MEDYRSLLFNISVPTATPSVGALLVAEPFLRESYFNHSVICLIDYSPGKSTMGFVLNKITHYDLDDLIDELVYDKKIPIFCGGPMSCERLYCLHTLGEIIPNARHVTGDLYVGGDFDSIVDYINKGYPVEGKIRFFLGYSGWEAGQLEGEIRQDIWAVSDITDEEQLLIGNEDKYWHARVREMGIPYRGWLYHPQDPKMN